MAETLQVEAHQAGKAQAREWVTVGKRSDLIPGSGVGALVGDRQVAVFWLPELYDTLYAISNYCPISGVHLIARGIVGDIGGEPVVATPLYKQHFSLLDGRCLEESEHRLQVYPARFLGAAVQIEVPVTGRSHRRQAA